MRLRAEWMIPADDIILEVLSSIDIQAVDIVVSTILTTSLVILYFKQSRILNEQKNISERQNKITEAQFKPHLDYGRVEVEPVGFQQTLGNTEDRPIEGLSLNISNSGNGKAVNIRIDPVIIPVDEEEYDNIFDPQEIANSKLDEWVANSVAHRETINRQPREGASKNYLEPTDSAKFLIEGFVTFNGHRIKKPFQTYSEEHFENGDPILSGVVITYEDMTGKEYTTVIQAGKTRYNKGNNLAQMMGGRVWSRFR